MNPNSRRVLYFILWYGVYPNVWLLVLVSELFFDPANLVFLLTLLLSYFIGIIDTVVRPFSESIQEDASTNTLYTLILLIMFLMNPVIVALSFYESKLLILEYFPLWRNLLVSIIGILLIVIGGFILITGRYQLKQFGSGILTIEDNHVLLTSGILKYIRHPIYAGGLLGIIGFYCAFQSVVILIIVSLIWFLIFRHRLLFEEELLISEFGDQYREYMKQTKRIIPFLY